MLTAQEVKEFARECGADLVGIGDLERFNGAPKDMDPRYIYPGAKVIVGLGFRIARGYLRGIEEGTEFWQYPSMGYAGINEVFAPWVLHRMCGFIEDRGYEAAVIRNEGAKALRSDFTGEMGEPPEYGRTLRYAEPVADGKPAPNVQMHFRIAAYICGLGEIGYSKIFLTPQFGPRQRFAFLLTDAPLDVDPIYDGPPLCDRCMACVAECPGHCIHKDETVKVEVAGHPLEWGKLDEWQCFASYLGTSKEINPFLPRDAYDNIPDGDKILKGEKQFTPAEAQQAVGVAGKYYGSGAFGYGNAMCGGRGCLRACMVHLEQTDRLSNKFESPFRKGKRWKL